MLTLDAGSGYWQLPVDDKSVKLLTLKKNMGSISTGMCQKRRWKILVRGSRPVEIIVDYFLIHGEYQQKPAKS